MKPQTEHLLGIAEVAELANVTRSTVHAWIDSKSANFPEPILRLRMGPVFDAAEIRAWLEARRA